jgi:hypothetical protein
MTTSSPIRELALHRLGQSEPLLALDPWQYSSYKHGSLHAADALGRALTDLLLTSAPDITAEPNLLLAASPYRHVPTAAAALARAVHRGLADARAVADLPDAPLIRIERRATTSNDYAALSPAAREAVMAGNHLAFAALDHPAARGAHLIVIDDIKITGAHQRALIRASERLPLGSRTFLYLAAAAPNCGRTDPGPQDRLDRARIKTLSDFAELLDEVGTPDGFAWNVRVCRFLLDPRNRADLPTFLAQRTGRFLREAHRYATIDGYDDMPAYHNSFLLLERELDSRNLIVHDPTQPVTLMSRG